MPMKRTRPSIRRRPARGTLVRYGDRIAEVLGEARSASHDQIDCLADCVLIRPAPSEAAALVAGPRSVHFVDLSATDG